MHIAVMLVLAFSRATLARSRVVITLTFMANTVALLEVVSGLVVCFSVHS